MWLLDRFLRRFVVEGALTVVDARGVTRRYGDPHAAPVQIRLADRALERQLAFDPGFHLGEGYTDGRLVVERGDVTQLLRLCMINLTRTHSSDGLDRLLALFDRLRRAGGGRNRIARAGDNVARHYDLSDELFDSFLDRERQYSCAYFTRPDLSLDEAQAAKQRHIAAKLLLRPGQRVLDIGCGWGGLALALARTAAVSVDGVTLSREQLDHATRRAEAEGLAERVRFALADYRRLAGRYDRIVSVGMFEHVGRADYATFFRQVRSLLAPGGVALLHSIGRLHGPRATSAWIRRHIFPGGHIPALSEVLPEVERSGLYVTDIEILRQHYAETLRHWRERFLARRDSLRGLQDERFRRMWEFYLAASEMSFRHDDLAVFQLQLSNDIAAVPLTRDYIEAFERDAATPNRDLNRDRASAA